MRTQNVLPDAARIGRKSIQYSVLHVWPSIQQDQEPLNEGIFSYVLEGNLGEKNESEKIRRFVFKENASDNYYYFNYYYIYNFDGYTKSCLRKFL